MALRDAAERSGSGDPLAAKRGYRTGSLEHPAIVVKNY
jgi:hypothetical protein